MDYASYRQVRDEQLAKRRPLRLDCMNPAKALAAWATKADAEPAPEPHLDTRTRTLTAWSNATGIHPQASRLGTGVRDLLTRLMPELVAEVDEIWSPEDVYPVYARLIGTLRPRREYRTIPDVDWTFLHETSRRALLLCPFPLSPLGRIPTNEEITKLVTWLLGSPERVLLLDTAYAYDFPSVRGALTPLLAMDRVVVLWSCTKSWLLPDTFGVASLSKALDASLRHTPGEPESAALARAAVSLTARPDLPQAQQRAFDREWTRLSQRILEAMPAWRPPETGYFSIIDVPFETLLERFDILAVPASVFGSRSEGHAVITCLHDLALHEDAPP